MLVRPGRPGEAARLQQLEIEAGALFADIGMHQIADDEPPSIELLDAAIAEERLWVAEIDLEPVAGYAMAIILDGAPHLEQVSVSPAHQRRGVGRALVNEGAEWARHLGADSITLTTFRDVAWNGPLYERLGFVTIDDADLDDALRRVRAHEIELGLDAAGPRVAMRRIL
ncbi:MAG: GNAT family N-acetyltransferase [Microthrixaceae bacterium]